MNLIKKNKNIFLRNPKKTLFAFLSLSIITLLFFAELILQIFFDSDYINNNGTVDRYIRLREFRPNSSYRNYFTENNDPFLNIKKDFIYSNIDENGFIKPSIIHKNPDVSIVFLGGSTTECGYVDELNRFPYLVGRKLEKKINKKINSINAGCSGNNSLHSIFNLFAKIIPLKPRIVVLMHNINDASVLYNSGNYWNKLNSKSPIVNVEKNQSILFLLSYKFKKVFPILSHYIYSEINRYFISQDEFNDTRNLEKKYELELWAKEFRANLLTYIYICRARNIDPVLMTQANRFPEWIEHHKEKNEFKKIFDRFTQIIRDVAINNKVPLIDLEAKIPKDREYIYDLAHYTDKGSIRASEIISDDIIKVFGEQ